MPIYEYVCTHCGEPVEKLQKLSDAPLTDCPACGEASLKRKVSAAGFRLAGGGWYETDFKSDRRRNVAGDASKSSSDASSSGDSSDASKSGGKSKSAEGDAAKKSGGESKSGESSTKPSSKTAGKAAGAKSE